jgi:hypothetical protein
LDTVINGSVAAMPAALRGGTEARLDTRTRARLNSLMTTWSGGGNMDRTEFAGQFFGRAADDPVAMGLRTAALTARLSGNQDALRDAAEHLAGAMQAIGLDRWPRFLDDAEARANDPSTLAALDKSRQTLVPRDAIRPVYPIETAIGIAAAGVAGGAAGVARAVGRAVVRQLLPERPPAMERPQTQPNKPSDDAPGPSPKEKPPEPTPPLPKARVSPDRRTHILEGDPGGGGHRPGTGFKDKSEFPAGWSDDKIITEIENVANDPASTRIVQPNGRTRVEGSRDGVDIRVIINPDRVTIRTAHPANMPINP